MSSLDGTQNLDPDVLDARSRMGRTDWEELAACRGLPDDQLAHFYPEAGVGMTAKKRRSEELAATFCNEVCPVQKECLQQALDADEVYGVWGGTTEVERQRMLALIPRRRTA